MDVDRVARRRDERGVAGLDERPHEVDEPLLRAHRRDDLGLGVELDAEAAAVEVGARRAELGDALRGGVAVVVRLRGRLLQLRDGNVRARAGRGCRTRGRRRPPRRGAARASARGSSRTRTAAGRRAGGRCGSRLPLSTGRTAARSRPVHVDRDARAGGSIDDRRGGRDEQSRRPGASCSPPAKPSPPPSRSRPPSPRGARPPRSPSRPVQAIPSSVVVNHGPSTIAKSRSFGGGAAALGAARQARRRPPHPGPRARRARRRRRAMCPVGG